MFVCSIAQNKKKRQLTTSNGTLKKKNTEEQGSQLNSRLSTFNCEGSFRLGSSERISGHAHIDTCVLRVSVADLKSDLAGLGVERGPDVVGEHERDELVGILRGAAKPLDLRGWLRLADAGERDLLAVHGLHLGEKRRQKDRRTVLANAERCVGLEFDPGLADGGQRSGLIQSLHHVEAFVGCYG